MEEVMTAPKIQPGLKGIELAKAILEMQKFISEYLAKGGTFEELESMGYQFGTLNLENLLSRPSECIVSEPTSSSEKFQPKLHPVLLGLLEQRKFFSKHFSDGGTLSELETMGYKFGKVDL